MRFIQVGVGGFGRRWVDVLKAEKQAKVVGMVDVSPQSLEAACAQAGYDKTLCFPSLKQTLRAVQADAVVICTPPKFHRAPAVEAMKAGLDVICEKPMAESPADCQAMLRTAQQTRRTCVISQNYRYTPATWTLAKLVESGVIGEIGQVKVDFYLGMNFGGGFRHSMDYPVIVDMSIHHFDLMRFITGLDAARVRGASWNPRWSNYRGDCSSTALFELTNGAHLLYNASWCAKGQFTGWNGVWQIEGNKGTILYRDEVIQVYDVPDLYKVKRVKTVKPKAPPALGQSYVLKEFIRSARSGKRPATCVQDNIRSVSMVFATVEAVRTGRPVKVLAKGR